MTDEQTAKLLWGFMLDQLHLIRVASERNDVKGGSFQEFDCGAIEKYLRGMLKQGPEHPGLILFAQAAKKSVSELESGVVDWEQAFKLLEDGPRLTVVKGE